MLLVVAGDDAPTNNVPMGTPSTLGLSSSKLDRLDFRDPKIPYPVPSPAVPGAAPAKVIRVDTIPGMVPVAEAGIFSLGSNAISARFGVLLLLAGVGGGSGAIIGFGWYC